jgi:hypothetical protein
MWESPPPLKLDTKQLDNIWSWYTDWLDMHDGEMPDLDEEDFEMISSNIERLFGYIAFLKKTFERVKEMKVEMEAVKLEIHKFNKRKRDVVRSSEVEDKMPMMKRVKRQAH